MDIEIVNADYNNPQHAKDLVYVLNSYAEDPMGGNEALPKTTTDNLADALSRVPHALSIICYVDNNPAGLINCFEAFSTFKCQPVLNIHDVAVMSEYRGLGLSQKMMARIEKIAADRGCCKLTLEVLEGNIPAKNAYIKYGFEGYELDPEMGVAQFWEKAIKN